MTSALSRRRFTQLSLATLAAPLVRTGLGQAPDPAPGPGQASESTRSAGAERKVALPAGPNAWPLFRGDALSTGVAASDLPAELALLWQFTAQETNFAATPAIAAGVCYLGDLDGTLYALDLTTGQTRWRQKTESFGFSASPALTTGSVYLGDFDGKFFAFDLQGNVRWEFAAGAEISSSANFHRDRVLFGSQDATLYCLQAASGALVWKHQIQDQIRCSPTIVEDRAFVAGCDGQLHIIDLESGGSVAAVDIQAPTGVTPAVRGDYVYFGTYGGLVFCVDWRQAKVVWTFEDQRGREIRSSPAVDNQILVIGSRSKNVYGLDPKTGDKVWQFLCRRMVDASPVIVGDRVIVAGSDGLLYLLSAETGELLWQREMGGSFSGSPAVADRRLVIANDDGVVYCLGEQPA
jgi:outer membrane protein assembly factor BamB